MEQLVLVASSTKSGGLQCAEQLWDVSKMLLGDLLQKEFGNRGERHGAGRWYGRG